MLKTIEAIIDIQGKVHWQDTPRFRVNTVC